MNEPDPQDREVMGVSDDETAGESVGETPETGAGDGEAARPGRRRWTVAAAAAAVVLIAGGLYAGVRPGPGNDEAGGPAADATEPLTLDREAAEPAGEADPETGAAAAAYELVLDGPAPEAPGRAPVYRWPDGGPDRAAAEELAAALGVEGEMTDSSGTWLAGGPDAGGPALSVQQEAPGSWSYTPGTVSADGAAPGDPGQPVEMPSARPSDGAEPPSPAEALAVAEPLLARLGLDDARVDAAQEMGESRVVTAVPLLGGLPAAGLTTELWIGPDGTLDSAFGFLGLPAAGEERDVNDVRDALTALNAGAGATGPAMPCPELMPAEDEQAAVACGEPAPAADGPLAVTAELGLALDISEEQPVLVPSWLFRASGAGPAGPFAADHPAIDTEFATPADEGEGAGEAVPAEPGDLPGEGWSVAPHEPSDTTLTLRFWSSPCDEYAVVAEESGDRVTLDLELTNPDPERVCVMLAEERTGTVTLDEPVGDRTLTGPTGEDLPIR